jgi:hypothetical protein
MKFWHGWWRVRDNQSDSFDNLDWCEKMFGPRNANGRWFWHTEVIPPEFYFRNKDDALMYMLRWA